MPASLRPRRSALYVPGSNPRAIEKARTIAADAAAVHSRLADKAREAKADEVFVMATGPTLEARIRSLELIADIHRSAA